MNGKLYVFGIGGTGARVLKALVMLAASGVKIEADAIVPIIIDPDKSNGDLTRTVELIKNYSNIRTKLIFNDTTSNTFFSTLFEDVADGYHLQLVGTNNGTFRQFIKYGDLKKENKALTSILFSEKNLESIMDVGFKGNPNIGSVVLNQFTHSQQFKQFASNFKDGDRIFIISSIFGGTGASGFPLLLKNLRSSEELKQNDIPNFAVIQKAPIGAITVLPYFGVKVNEKSEIDSSTFIGKTKAALQYYEKSISDDKRSSVNVMYYVGDNRKSEYENHEGKEAQINNAHIVELISALSIIDFAAIDSDDQSMTCKESEDKRIYAPHVAYKEYGIKEDVDEVLFSHLGDVTRGQLCKPMTQFVLFSKYIEEHLSKEDILSQPWANDNKITKAYLKTSFVEYLNKFTTEYLTWLKEMADNDRKFKPYTLSVGGNNLYSIVNGIEPEPIRSIWAFNKSGYDLFDTALNRMQSSLSENYSVDQKFIELFCKVSMSLVDKKFKF